MRLETQRLVIRNWQDRDRELFFQINSDDRVMAFFPFRRDREQADQLFDLLRDGIARNGYGFAALELRATGTTVGFAGIQPAGLEPTLPAETFEIGWRLAPEFWSNGYASEAAKALLAYGFGDLGLSEIVSFAVWNNTRSTAVMERIGMRRVLGQDFDHPKVPESHPDLRRHVLYRLAREDWLARATP
ncbi:GNAT family N-acetyltransferase [Nitratireductor sp. CAU 1489]|uniref:GNAT family N-acetyltransferase n=1 Tax=Nitratireductor arenosus TaxID=2682096 RepID=A0A844QGT5_9HYPH|nr:GNAT family N-acetyltransferase [Nitratireductor arenosus]MVA97191.1 GNAT family N-acetyltransferase [Nitratireductor arenosus]